jgi:hypothetical protein
MNELLQQLYPNQTISPVSINEIPKTGYMVYILSFKGKPIVLGHGKRNRSKVIFDSEQQITTGHIKAIFVRLYNLYGKGEFERFIITCNNKEEAKTIESNLHKQIGGNNRNIPIEIRQQLFQNLDPKSASALILEIALRSSFDGLSDIKKWRADQILDDEIWSELSLRLRLDML